MTTAVKWGLLRVVQKVVRRVELKVLHWVDPTDSSLAEKKAERSVAEKVGQKVVRTAAQREHMLAATTVGQTEHEWVDQ